MTLRVGPARRIAFINEKGGTGKTTLAVNTAAWLAAKREKRVLLVDLDTQGHAAKSLGIDVRTVTTTAFDWLTRDDVSLQQVAQPTATVGLSVIPAYKQLAELPQVLSQDPHRGRRLARRLEGPEADAYDYIVFDGPPSLGLVTTNILVAATEVVIPVGVTYLSLDGCAEMVQTVERVASEFARPDLKVSLVVPTLYRKTALADEILAKLQEYFPDRCAAPVALNVAIDEAQSHGKTIWEYAPWSRGATLLQAVAESVERAGSAPARKTA
ncbi:MAG: ParA family protein [Archangiaceae bacterium]|nr:ParA family protein [Archangiaceae bacterium]